MPILTRLHVRAWQDLLEGIKGFPGEKPRVFISYAWIGDAGENAKQQRWLKDLEEDLTGLGISVFLDVLDMHDDMTHQMSSGIEHSEAAIIVCTPTLKTRVASQSNVAFEVQKILDKKTQDPSFQILPLIYSGSFGESVPSTLGGYLVRDCVDKSKYVKQLIGLDTPAGVVPGLLGIRRGNLAYETLLSRYRMGCISNLPFANPIFCGRESLLNELEQGFSGTHGNQPQVLSGLGGVGKTQLALTYAHQHRESYQICRWLLTDGEQLSLSIHRFAEELGIDTQGLEEAELVSSIYQTLAHYSYLLIFDNADDTQRIREYLPKGALQSHQNILITSRSANWRRKIALHELTPAEAFHYLRAQLPEADDVALHALASTLSYFPLALSQAVAYIRASGIHVNRYVSLVSRNTLSALNEADLEETYHYTIQNTWALSKQKIQEHPDALLLLNACVWLGADEIPIYLLEHSLLLGNAFVVLEALKILHQYSMVEEIKPGYLKIHRLVQHVLREDIEALPVLERVNRALYNIYPRDKVTQEDIAHTRELIEHFTTVMAHDEQKMLQQPEKWQEHYLNMNFCLSDAYGDLGNPGKKKDLLERALVIQESQYGPEHYQVAITLVNLGNAYGALGNPGKQKDLLERALVILEKHYGPEHNTVTIARKNFAKACQVLAQSASLRSHADTESRSSFATTPGLFAASTAANEGSSTFSSNHVSSASASSAARKSSGLG